MISVVIVTYNSREHIAQCLDSFRASGAEIVVVDNGSKDGTPELVRQGFPGVQLIAAPGNLGFAAGANLGAKRAKGTTLLIANPDIVCQGSCQASLDLLEEALGSAPDVVAVAPQLVDENGRMQIGFNVRRLPTPAALIFELLGLNRLFPNNPVNRRYRCLDMNFRQPAEVEQPAGACLLIRRTAFESCGGFDERFYPLWFEDVDLCLRLRQRGKILFWPQVVFRHAGGHSLESITFSERQVYWYRNLLYYVKKHFPWTTGIAIRAAVGLGVFLRLGAELLGITKHSQDRALSWSERVCAYWKAAKLSLLGWR